MTSQNTLAATIYKQCLLSRHMLAISQHVTTLKCTDLTQRYYNNLVAIYFSHFALPIHYVIWAK